MKQYQENKDALADEPRPVIGYSIDGMSIPVDTGNRHYQQMQAELNAEPPEAEILPWIPPSTEEEEAAEQQEAIASTVESNQLYSAMTVLAAKLDGATTTVSEAGILAPYYLLWSELAVAYATGQLIRYDDKVWQCISGHTSQVGWEPPAVPALWAVYVDPSAPPVAWVQPLGAHDAYRIDAQVLHNGDTWVSTVASNVWEPSVYGWTVI